MYFYYKYIVNCIYITITSNEIILSFINIFTYKDLLIYYIVYYY